MNALHYEYFGTNYVIYDLPYNTRGIHMTFDGVKALIFACKVLKEFSLGFALKPRALSGATVALAATLYGMF